MRRRRWMLWIAGGTGLFWLFTPGGRSMALLPGGVWIIFLTGIVWGYAIAGWWGSIQETEPDLLRRRLVSGEIRLSEYRLLCRELGIGKKNVAVEKNEEEFSPADGT